MKMAAKKNIGELGMSIGMIVVAILFIALADFKQHANPMDPGPALFPRLTGGFTIFFCLLQIIVSLRDKAEAKEESSEEEKKERRKASRTTFIYILGTLILTVIYIALFDHVKYILLTAVFLAAIMLLLGVRKWVVLISVAVLYAVLSWVLYGLILMVPLN